MLIAELKTTLPFLMNIYHHKVLYLRGVEGFPES
ncbi:hypothetical protein C8E01_1257 [Pontibacter virosus]|uniref:Uncharacterized protein n=1 Tax=Pontibacter virosus TaxID=1765052 RepID=A0A2U1AJH4_9BACT|nr:hypothetical protein C8E01_1257 [Pontibacter virosus]